MKNDFLLETVQMDCPFCDTVHSIEKRKRIVDNSIKNVSVQYDELYYYCSLRADEDENEFCPAGMMDANLLRGRDAYREKAGLLTSGEIIAIRNFYDMSQSDFALLLGWGEVTITRYETKSIQDETYDKLMRMVGESPAFAYESLQKHRNSFAAHKYNALKYAIQQRIEMIGDDSIQRQAIKSAYAIYDEPSDFNGYQILDLTKLATMAAYFAKCCAPLYKVKLMKLLWYADALAYQSTGKAISGLVYRHEKFGALPVASRDIIYLSSLTVQEEELQDMVRYNLSARDSVDLSCLTNEEVDFLSTVAQRFKSTDTETIVGCMHNEDAYQYTEMHQIIPFSLCKGLRAF